MIKILYFAKTRETIRKGEETLELPAGPVTVADIINLLVARGEPYNAAFEESRVLAAINQEMTSLSSTVSDGDELAFFPPVTGG